MKWQTLRHNGVAFPPPYAYRALTIRIKNEAVTLTPETEEMLMAWAKKKDTPYVNDPIFQKNFLGDLKIKLGPRFADLTLAEIDFTELHAMADREKTANLSPEEKKARAAQRKIERAELKAKFGTAIIDGVETEIGAYLVEPPGILMGRGEHPLRGKWKDRIQPHEVTLNLDEDAPKPEGAWKIVHEHDATWIAAWDDKLSDKRKYVWLADSSSLRQERDKEKYLKAAKLESSVDKVRAEIAKRMDFTDKSARGGFEKQQSQLSAKRQALETKLEQANQVGDSDTRAKIKDELALEKQQADLNKRADHAREAETKTRQLATVCYLIDRLAMRVGDEKDEDEADTVGASTLRVEHIQIGRDLIEFRFLGKDSVEWHKSIPLDHAGAILAHNLEDFMRNKKPSDQIFDQIDSVHINRFLSSIVSGLSAKVFRTYHATHAVRACLASYAELTPAAPQYEKENVAKLANLEAAIVCNHKRTPAKNWQETLNKREVELKKLRDAKPDVQKLKAQIPARQAALDKLLAAPPTPETLAAQVVARQAALDKLRAAQAALAKFDGQIKQQQRELEELSASLKPAQASAQTALEKKQAALAALEKQTPPTAKKALADYTKRLSAARQMVTATQKANDHTLGRLKDRINAARKALDAKQKNQRAKTRGLNAKLKQAQAALTSAQQAVALEPKRYAERLAKAQAALKAVRAAPDIAQKNYEERVEKSALQLDLAKRTRDYNLGTSLKNYIDPRVYKAWGDYIGYDWKRLYTTTLQRKFAWVEHEHPKWQADKKTK